MVFDDSHSEQKSGASNTRIGEQGDFVNHELIRRSRVSQRMDQIKSAMRFTWVAFFLTSILFVVSFGKQLNLSFFQSLPFLGFLIILFGLGVIRTTYKLYKTGKITLVTSKSFEELTFIGSPLKFRLEIFSRFIFAFAAIAVGVIFIRYF